MSVRVERLTPDTFRTFVSMICELAAFEKLDPPSNDAIERLHVDAFSASPRYEAYIAVDDTGEAHGYIIVFETYSSFLARPTLYLEDIYVRQQSRRNGVGSALFEYVVQLANDRGCGRVDFQVLDWNHDARVFYKGHGANAHTDWLLHRVTLLP